MIMRKSKWLTLSIVVACAGCCTIPLFAILTGTAGVGMMSILWSEKTLEIFKCLVPLLIVGMAGVGYFFYRKYKVKKQCCDTPQTTCSDKQCSAKSGNI